MRVVFDTNVVLSALLFRDGRLAWLRAHWAGPSVTPLASKGTTSELIAVLAYPKFELTSSEIKDLLSEYLPHVTLVERVPPCELRCRDAADQKFVDLAEAGRATVLVSGDRDLLALKGQARFAIETPDEYRKRL